MNIVVRVKLVFLMATILKLSPLHSLSIHSLLHHLLNHRIKKARSIFNESCPTNSRCTPIYGDLAEKYFYDAAFWSAFCSGAKGELICPRILLMVSSCAINSSPCFSKPAIFSDNFSREFLIFCKLDNRFSN